MNEFTRTSILFFNNLDFDDSGSYVCRAVNNLVSPVMTDSESATFTVNRKCFVIMWYIYIHVHI